MFLFSCTTSSAGIHSPDKSWSYFSTFLSSKMEILLMLHFTYSTLFSCLSMTDSSMTRQLNISSWPQFEDLFKYHMCVAEVVPCSSASLEPVWFCMCDMLWSQPQTPACEILSFLFTISLKIKRMTPYLTNRK